jgi:hypothetical protein
MDRLKTVVSKYSSCVFFSLLVGWFVWAAWVHGCPVFLAGDTETLLVESAGGLDSNGGPVPVFPSKIDGIANSLRLLSPQGLPYFSMARAVPIVKGFQVERTIINPPIGPPPVPSAA